MTQNQFQKLKGLFIHAKQNYIIYHTLSTFSPLEKRGERNREFLQLDGSARRQSQNRWGKKKKNGQTVSNSLQQNTHIYTFPKTHCQEIGDQFAVKS